MVLRIDFSKLTCDSDNNPIVGTEEEMSVLYNPQIITEDEVKQLIHNNMIEFELRCIVTTRIQADYLKGLSPKRAEQFLTI